MDIHLCMWDFVCDRVSYIHLPRCQERASYGESGSPDVSIKTQFFLIFSRLLI